MLLDITILLMAAVITVPLFRVAGLGAVPGFLVAGALVGPSGLALIDNISGIGKLAELGVVILLFVIGIELKPVRLWLMRRLVFGLGVAQILVTGSIILAVVFLVFEVPFRTAVLVGPALALSSTAFVLQLLSEQRLLHSEYGRTSFAVLLMQDLAVVPLLALVPMLAAQNMTIGGDIAVAVGKSVAILLLVVLGGRYLLQPVLYRVAQAGSADVFTALAVLLVLGSALVTEHIGMSMATGAFIAGLLIADSPFRHQVVAEIQPFRGLLLGLFFMSMGMLIDLRVLLDEPVAMLGLLIALIAVKLLMLWPLTLLFGLGARTGAAVALLLAQSGEFGLVLFAYTHQAGLMDAALFERLLVIVVLSMLVTPLLARLARRLQAAQETAETTETTAGASAPIVLVGFGRVGRRIGDILSMAGRPYVAVDNDPVLVRRERGQGRNVYYGDARRPNVLRAMGATDAQLVIVTLDDFQATEDLVGALKGIEPGLTILARAHDSDQCRTLSTLGASFTVSENFEASLQLAREALARDGGDAAGAEAVIRQFRQDHLATIAGGAAGEARDSVTAAHSS